MCVCSLTIPSMISKMCDTITQRESGRIIRVFRLQLIFSISSSYFSAICFCCRCVMFHLFAHRFYCITFFLARSIYMFFCSLSTSFFHIHAHTRSQVLSISIEYKCTFACFDFDTTVFGFVELNDNNAQSIKMRVDEFSMSFGARVSMCACVCLIFKACYSLLFVYIPAEIIPDAMSIEYQMKLNGISICTCVSYEKREICFTTQTHTLTFTMTASQSCIDHRNFPYSLPRFLFELISFICFDFIFEAAGEKALCWLNIFDDLFNLHAYSHSHTHTHARIKLVLFLFSRRLRFSFD